MIAGASHNSQQQEQENQQQQGVIKFPIHSIAVVATAEALIISI